MNGNEVPLVRAIRGPVTLITIGVLFALNNFTAFGFDRTWPVLLIVFGLLSLLRRGMEPVAPERPRYSYPPPPPTPPPPFSAAGGYRQSNYPGSETGSGASTGGFGTSAPARPVETAESNSGEPK